MVVQLALDQDPKVIAELEQIVAREAEVQGAEGVDARTDFHAAIARLSGNKTLQIVSAMLHHIIEKANRSLQPTAGVKADQANRRSGKTHRMLVDLIKAGDAKTAGELWGRHLKSAEEYVLAGSELSTVVDLLE
jgi:DNA-binding FadR family transcriptional regulator